jgi:hypothetical protein
MELNFAAAITALTRGGVNPAFRIINEARVPGDYLWSRFLPERLVNSYDVKAGNMTIVPTMAGLAGADSPYAPSGLMDVSTFLGSTAKIANTVPLTEMFMRRLHSMMQTVGRDVQGDVAATNIILNFINLLLVQAHLDRMELLRGEALTTGAVAWTFVGKDLAINYGIPQANLLANRTGNDAYHGSASKWWTDYRTGRSLLKGQVEAVVAHPDTIDAIVSNDVNKIFTSSDSFAGPVPLFRNVGGASGPLIASPDARDRTTIIGYPLEGAILDPENPGETINLPFCPRGKVVMIGRPAPRGFELDIGGVSETPENALELGYTHIGPTVEGKGALGRWARVYTPDDEDWMLIGKAVTNGAPVLEAPTKVVVLSTDMPA